MLHKNLVREIAFFRKKRLGDILNGESGLNLNKVAIKNGKNIAWLNGELDSIFYTLSFLEKHGLIEIRTYANNTVVHLFDGIPAEGGEVSEIVNSLHFYYDKLSKSAYSWEVEMKPGLLSFIDSGFKTEDELKEERNFKLTIGAALLAAFATASFTYLFGEFADIIAKRL